MMTCWLGGLEYENGEIRRWEMWMASGEAVTSAAKCHSKRISLPNYFNLPSRTDTPQLNYDTKLAGSCLGRSSPRRTYEGAGKVSKQKVGRDGSVGFAIHYEVDGPKIESRWRRDFPHPSRQVLGHTQPPIKMGTLTLNWGKHTGWGGGALAIHPHLDPTV
jgi:hypothetical protein